MFKPELITLTVADKKTVGLTCGNGPVPCLIVGPASFYLNKFSDQLKEKFTFYAFDDLWSYRQNDPIDSDAIKKEDFSSQVIKVKNLIYALKEHYRYPKIGLIGFSVPGLIAIDAGEKIGNEHIAFVIGSGIGSRVLDPEFKAAHDYFEKHAESPRKTRYKEDYDAFERLKTQALDPTTLWRETVRSIETKQIYDYENASAIEKLLDDWSYTPDRKIICETMRQHFFNQILPQIDPPKLIEELVNTTIPFMLVYGKHDYTTPPPRKSDRNNWQTHPNFFFQKYALSVHYPSSEPGSQPAFDSDVLAFLEKHELNKMPTINPLT